MSQLKWDKIEDRSYETGVDHGVLYPYLPASQTEPAGYRQGYAWNGLTAVNESPSGAEPTPLYADNIKYLNLMSAEEFAASIEAYTYPDEFAECNGEKELAEGINLGQQPRRTFGLAYRTKIGTAENSEAGYKIHLIYGCLAAPSEKAYSTINDSPEAITFSWEISTTPVEVEGFKPTATLVIDSTKVNSTKLTEIEENLFGRDADTEKEITAIVPHLLLPDEVLSIINSNEEDEEEENADVQG